MSSALSTANPLVFLVDDDVDSAEMYATVVGTRGFRVVTSGCLADALSQLSALKPDVIIADIRLRDGSGLGLVRHIRACGVAEASVLVLTACAFPSELAEATLSGCDAVITKPCLPDSLAAAVRSVLDDMALRRVMDRIRAAFLQRPGVHLTPAQVQRLCGIDPLMCIHGLDALVADRFLHQGEDLTYGLAIGGTASDGGAEATAPGTLIHSSFADTDC